MKHLSPFLQGKSEHSLLLFDHFVGEFEKLSPIQLHPSKSMIGIGVPEVKVAYITQFGKNFIHVVFPFKQPYPDNLCFQKIARVPGTKQYNHHFRMLFKDDVNKEVISFINLAISQEL